MRRPMLTQRRTIVLAVLSLLTLALLAIGAFAAERVAPQSAGAAKTPPPTTLPAVPENAEEIQAQDGPPEPGAIITRRPARTRTPMMAEIFAYMESRDQLLAAKRQQYVTAKSDRVAAAAIQQEMQQMKLETELAVLRIQARHATKEGRTADAQRIEASILERLDPKITLAPEKRPVPQSSTQR